MTGNNVDPTVVKIHSQNILHVIPSVSLIHGGPSWAIVSIEKSLSSKGLKITTATTDDDGPGCRLEGSAKLIDVSGATRIYFRKWFDFYKVAPGFLPWLWKNIDCFDVVHIHALFSFTSIAAGTIAWIRRVPYVVRPLGTLATYGVTQRRPWLKKLSLRFLEGPVLRRAAYVHCTSQSELDEARALGIPFRGGVLALGVEKPQSECSASTNKVRKPTALFLSRLDPKKNVESLLRAFAIVVRERKDAVLLIAGNGPEAYVANLKQQADNLSIGPSIMWLGHVEGEAKAAAFAGADVFVLPSYSENFGIAAVEAMLTGIPCILGQGVGIAGEIEAAGAGWVVAPDPSSIATAIALALDDVGNRKRMGERARLFAEREYSTDAMATRLVSLYASLANNRKASAL